MILPCKNCKHYWQDVKYCTKHKVLSFVPEFEKVERDKCFEKKEELEVEEIYDKIRKKNSSLTKK